MFLRDVLKRWNERPVGAASGDGAADGCPPTPSLLEELATDPEDFADLARVLKLDLQAVIGALVTAQRQTPAELVERLTARHAASAAPEPLATAAADAETPSPPAPLVWARVALDRHGSVGTVYAGWLTPGAVEEIASVAGAGGGDTQVEITVALADDDARLARVQELCATIVERLPLEVRAGEPAAPTRRKWLPLNGEGQAGWGRWMRARAGARIHRDAAEREPGTAVRPAMAAS